MNQRLIEALCALPNLRQGDIEPTALLFDGGRVAIRIASPDTYPGDLHTAALDTDLCEALALIISHRAEIIEALKART